MSSRQNRADKSVFGPEDFMDEEVGVQSSCWLAGGMLVGGCGSTLSLPRKYDFLIAKLYLLGIWTIVPFL